jgi:hypothetical protein
MFTVGGLILGPAFFAGAPRPGESIAGSDAGDGGGGAAVFGISCAGAGAGGGGEGDSGAAAPASSGIATTG